MYEMLLIPFIQVQEMCKKQTTSYAVCGYNTSNIFIVAEYCVVIQLFY